MHRIAQGGTRVLLGGLWRDICVVTFVFFAIGCSHISGTRGSAQPWLIDGSLALSRPVPNIELASSTGQSASPAPEVSSSSGATQIIVSRQAKTVTALRPGQSPLVFKSEGAQLLSQGSFSVTMKEDRPLWYAPNSYFLKRSLPVPDEGSRERFMRAALGSKALFLNDQTPIHSGPVWLREIGGLRVKSTAMEQLYSMVTVGTRVEVR